MANLSITLELDNRGYITGIKASEDAIKRFGQTSQAATDQASRGMERVNSNSQLLSRNFERLRNAVLGAAFVTFARSALLAADRVSDLSEATGIAIAQLYELEFALANSGGKAENLDKIITKFYQSIEDGLEVGSEANKIFEKLGVTTEELSKLPAIELFKQSMQGLQELRSESAKTDAALKIFGKSLVGVAPDQFAAKLQEAAGKFEGTAKATEDADAAVQQFQNTVRELQLAFIETFNPIIQGFNWLLKNLPAINILMKILLGLVIAIAVASGVRLLVAGLQAAVRAAAALKNLLNFRRAPTRPTQADNPFAMPLPNTADDIAERALRQQQAAFGIGALGGGAFAAGSMIFGGAEDQQQAAVANGIQDGNIERTVRQGNAAERLASRLDNLRDKVADIAKNYNQYSQELNDNLRMQEKHLGMSENQIEVDKAVADVRKEASRRIADYQTMLENLKKDEMGLAPIIKQQIENIKLRAQADETSVRLSTEKIQQYKESLEQLADAQELKNLRLGNEESLQSLQDEIDLVGLYGDQLEDQQALLAVTQELRSKLLGIQQEENDLILKKDQLGADAFNREMARLKALREEAYIYAEERLKLEEELIAKQRELSQDWQKELGKQLEDLADSISPARLAANMFGSVIRSVDDALTQFVEKGKFNFKEFARSLLRDMALIIARALIMRAILQAFGMAGFGPMAAGGSSAMALNYTGPQFGGFAANGGKVMPGKGYIVGERGPELFMPKAIGNIVPNNQLGMAAPSQTQVTYNINAVDAQSFRTLVARDPSFIFNVSEVGRRSSPARRLA